MRTIEGVEIDEKEIKEFQNSFPLMSGGCFERYLNQLAKKETEIMLSVASSADSMRNAQGAMNLIARIIDFISKVQGIDLERDEDQEGEAIEEESDGGYGEF